MDRIEFQFIRLSIKKEDNSDSAKRRACNRIPKKEGWHVGYKPYGIHGRGFYYWREVLENE